MGVMCEGGEGVYGIPEGLVFSVPVRQCEDGEGGRMWRVERGLDINKEIQVSWFMKNHNIDIHTLHIFYLLPPHSPPSSSSPLTHTGRYCTASPSPSRGAEHSHDCHRTTH